MMSATLVETQLPQTCKWLYKILVIYHMFGNIFTIVFLKYPNHNCREKEKLPFAILLNLFGYVQEFLENKSFL